MSGLTAFETDVQVIVQCIRVMRVFRIFRVIRVIRVISVNQSYAFQRQVFVLVMTVLSLVFAAAGLFQVFESQPGKEYPFHKAVYYAAITVIGRPGVPFTAAVTAVFLTGLALSAATIIPTFVAELIRLWYDNTALDWYTHNPEAPHVIVCGDTNASRLRVLVTQYFHPSRNPNELGPIVILAEGKPEGALRALLEQYKHSGAVQYIRGSGRRTADLRRAKAQFASTAIVLNYRADKDPGTADTEVLSTIMAVKSVKPSIRVLAQLQRPRKRNQLKLVPGWSDGDKAIAAHALGMALVGVGTRLPGFPTLVTHLLRRGAGHEASAPPSLRSRMAAGWATFLHGEGAAGTGQDFRDVDDATGRLRSRTPLDEYAASMDNSLYEVWVTPGLVGRTFGAAARLAYLRYGVTLIGATVPVNEALHSVMPGLPRTFRTALFPADAVLSLGMRLYAISPYAEPLQQMHLETGGRVRNVLEKVVDDVKWLPFAGVVPPEVAAAGVGVEAKEGEIPVAVPAPDGTAGGISIPLPSFSRPGEQYAHNNGASADLTVAWCWAEHDLDGGNTNAFLALLHMNVGGSASGEASGHSTGGAGLCERCGKPSAKRLDARLLAGVGIRTLDASRGLSAFEGAPPAALAVGVDNPLSLPTKQAAPVSGAQFDPFSGAQGEAEEEEQGTPAASSGSGPSDSPSLPSALALALNPIVGRDGRRPSMGDDGFGGIDDTDDVVGMRGPLVTATPSLKNAGSAAAAASAATAANTNALAVRLALPMGAQASEDLTLVMPTGAGGSGLASAAGGKPSFTGHVLVCGVSESIGLLLRALASLTTQARAAERGGVRALSTTLATAPKDYAEGEQYDIGPADVIVLAAAKPTDAAMNAMYAGSSLLLSRVTFLTGSPGDTAELVRAGVMGAKCAVVLTQAKPSVSADGSDNLSDDTEAIMTTAMLHKLNPSLHITTELLHGGHAPFILPVGASLNDAQRQAFAHILEEREAGRQRAQLDEAIRKLQSEQGVSLGNGTAASGSPASARLLAKLLRQQARLRALHGQPSPGGRGRAAGGTLSALDTRSAESMSLAAGGRVGGEREVEASYSGLSSTAIVDVLVGVREDFNAGAGAAGSEGAGFGGGAGGAAGGSSKGSGATADLFSSPAFASGRVFSFATLDSIITEAHFAPYMVPLVKQVRPFVSSPRPRPWHLLTHSPPLTHTPSARARRPPPPPVPHSRDGGHRHGPNRRIHKRPLRSARHGGALHLCRGRGACAASVPR